ncbi:MAG: hypothetical protein R3E01_28200 [Pirellulaceae bacterium]|nr:hypothetical protein [Planctomycetales bacterium]
MSVISEIPSISVLDRLRLAIQSVAPEAILVEPRILRRVIRLDRRLTGLGFSVPHASCYVIERARLLAYVDLEELELLESADLPRELILLSRPTDESQLGPDNIANLLVGYRRDLLHARVHLALKPRIAAYDSLPDMAALRRRQIGDVEFAEIRNVLTKSDLLFPDSPDWEVYFEFISVYAEFHHFAADDLVWYFPAIRDWNRIGEVIAADLDLQPLWRDAGALVWGQDVSPPDRSATSSTNATISSRLPLARTRTQQRLVRARRAAAQGNGIKAAILLQRTASERADGEGDTERDAAQRELRRVVERLQPALELTDDEVDAFCQALQPLVGPAASGLWNVEGRLLYDLQKVCVEHERGVFKLDLFEWCRQLGKCPLRRPLPLLREVLITKHLRTAERRLSLARISDDQRARLTNLLAVASHRSEHRTRDRIRPLILQALDDVDLVPRNVPEQVARQCIAEELLDVIVEQGVANFGNLRDALSKSDIKLDDLGGISEFLRGDPLLQIDRKLARSLDGIYRRGTLYLRLVQRLSSIAFGTKQGRFATQYLAIPFGGAYLIIEGVRHLAHWPSEQHVDPSIDSIAQVVPAEPQGTSWTPILLLGTCLLLLIHSSTVRRWALEAARRVWDFLRIAVVELPTHIFRSPLVRNVLASPAYAAFLSYLFWPGVFVLLVAWGASAFGRSLTRDLMIELFLGTALFLNSRIGRYVDERIADLLLRVWHDLRLRVFAALFDWVVDAFRQLFLFMERVVYTVDEWLRFRAGDNRGMQFVKLIGVTLWTFVSYFVIFAFTLLIEPQINPIKHFPVVTVSHKLLLPAGPAIVDQLKPYIGATRARSIVWSTIWLIPGVFGFLVWELKENWRLYQANRPLRLVPLAVGRHGESFVRLLRPGFHSGTLPKQFHAVRRALVTAHDSGAWTPFQRKREQIRGIETAVRYFVERRLVKLWQLVQLAPGANFAVDHVGVSTNRVEAVVSRDDRPDLPLRLIWEENDGVLVARAYADGWLDTLSPQQRDALVASVAGLFQLSGAEVTEAAWSMPAPKAFTWQQWVETWQAELHPAAG